MEPRRYKILHIEYTYQLTESTKQIIPSTMTLTVVNTSGGIRTFTLKKDPQKQLQRVNVGDVINMMTSSNADPVITKNITQNCESERFVAMNNTNQNLYRVLYINPETISVHNKPTIQFITVADSNGEIRTLGFADKPEVNPGDIITIIQYGHDYYKVSRNLTQESWAKEFAQICR